MELIRIGKIVNTHGIKGELRILSKFPYKDKVFVKNMKVYIDKNNIELKQNEYLDEQLIGLDVMYKNMIMGTIGDIERYDKISLIKINGKDRYYLIPYNFNLIDNIDIKNNKIYIKDIDGLFD